MIQRMQLLIGVEFMSQPVLSVLRGRSSVLFRHAVLAVALCGSVQVATASTTVDQLSNCLVK